MQKQWVISDIHGCLFTLRSLIETKIKPTGDDELIFLGDYIDRGPESKGVIDYILNLGNQGIKTTCLRGNHEEYILSAYEAEKNLKKGFFFKKKNTVFLEWLQHGGKEAMKSFEIENIAQMDMKYIEWFKNLQYYAIRGNYVIVHAGFNFAIDNPFEDQRAMLWTRDYEVIPEKIENRQIIHGHVPINIDFILDSVQNNKYPFIDLDNGCVYKEKVGMGNLLALELNTRELLIQYNADVY